MSVRPRSALTLALLVPLLLIALSACQPAQPFDPLAATTPFVFEVDNPDEVDGEVFGLLLYPFEPIPFASDVERYGALLNGFMDAALDDAGAIEGSFIAPRDVPRVNDGAGWFGGMRGVARSGPGFGGWLLFPPEECPMTATNEAEATFAAMQMLIVWDGETFDEEGLPVPTGYIEPGASTYVDDGTTWTWTYESMIPVMSRAAWSASTDGPCTFETWTDVTLDVDIEMDVGWQLLHVRSVETGGVGGNTWQETVRVVPLDDTNDLSDMWRVYPDMP